MDFSIANRLFGVVLGAACLGASQAQLTPLTQSTLSAQAAPSPQSSLPPPASTPFRDSLPAPSAVDPLHALVAEALRVNPTLRAARLESSASREDARAARALMPPKVGVELFGPADASQSAEDLGEVDYFVEQAFPWPGKRAARGLPALRQAQAADARARVLENMVAREVKEAYLELCLIDARLRINAGNQALVRRLVEIARRQYEVGLGGQADILRAHAELAQLSQQAVELAEGRESALAGLNALLDRVPDSFITTPDSLPEVPAAPAFERVLTLARARHPALAALAAEAGVREAEAGAAGKELWPDLMVRGTWQDMREAPVHGGSPGDIWAVMVAVDLPFALWSAPRHRSDSRAARTRAERVRLELRGEENSLSAGVRAALARMRSASEGLKVTRSALVPHAEQALHSVQAAYHAGKASFLEVMDAYRMVLGAREQEAEAVVKALRGRAELEAATGMDFEDIIQAAREPEGFR